MARVLVTNDGSHPPDKWAMLSAEVIFPLEGIEGADRSILGREVQLKVAKALLPIYTEVQDGEWAALVENPAEALARAMDPTVPTEAAVKAVLLAVAGSPWESHFAKPEVIGAVMAEVGSHVATICQVERDWAVADFADDPGVQAFVAAQAETAA